MRLERITSAEHPMYSWAMDLYEISFPDHERREEPSQKSIMNDPDYHFELIYEGDSFIGDVLFWRRPGFIYIEHFCILPEMRNRKYGQKVLKLLNEDYGTIILEIDPPVDDIAIRRKGFYERCGFKENPYPHVHPPYHMGNKGHELVIMSCPEAIPVPMYDDFNRHLKDVVMKEVY